jgi:Asp-tRNA(Asn)/Glu-tRNA(Gln) amidotransferase A subunit family amidase
MMPAPAARAWLHSRVFESATWHRPTDPDGAFVDGPGLLVAGAADGPLARIPLAVKDLLDVAGRVTGAGNPVIASRTAPATTTAPAVARLLAAGADVIGRTVTDELAYSLSGTNVHLGTPRNPALPGHEPGGSSAGSAVAASGAARLAIGTDTGGSVRVPASYCGVLGWRPTHGLVPVDGVVALSPSFDTVGLFARLVDAELLATAAALMAGPAWTPARPVTGLVLADDLLAPLEPDDARSVVAAVEWTAARLGVGIERTAVLPVSLAVATATFRTLQGGEAWRELGSLVAPGDLELGPGIAGRFRVASRVTPDEEAAAGAVRAAVREAFARVTADGRLVVQPAAAGPAPALDLDRDAKNERRGATLGLTAGAGLAGAPVGVVPIRPAGEPPLGLALVGAPGADATVLAAVAAVTPPR